VAALQEKTLLSAKYGAAASRHLGDWAKSTSATARPESASTSARISPQGAMTADCPMASSEPEASYLPLRLADMKKTVFSRARVMPMARYAMGG